MHQLRRDLGAEALDTTESDEDVVNGLEASVQSTWFSARFSCGTNRGSDRVEADRFVPVGGR